MQPPASSDPTQSRLAPLENVSPSIIIIVLILSVTTFVSVSLCLLLRFLRRRDSDHSNTGRVLPEITPNSGNPSIVDHLPLFTFSSVTRRRSSSGGGDCSVCLSKFEPDDQLRLLPLCCHAFHAECIDVWLNTNQTCPLCRSPIHASESDVVKATMLDPSGSRTSFRVDIGSLSRRQEDQNQNQNQNQNQSQSQRRSSFSIGSFEYVVDEESEVVRTQTRHHRRGFSDKEDPDPAMVAEVGGGGRSWLKDYMDRLSASISSRSLSFRSSGRFFTGSSRRTEFPSATGEYDLESNRIGEEITEMFRWFSGV